MRSGTRVPSAPLLEGNPTFHHDKHEPILCPNALWSGVLRIHRSWRCNAVKIAPISPWMQMDFSLIASGAQASP